MNKHRLFLGKNKHDGLIVYIPKNPRIFVPQTGFFSGTGAISTLGHEWILPDYSIIDTILTQDDYEKLGKFMDSMCNLGYIESKTDPNYNKALELYNNVQDIYAKLDTPENLKFYENCNKAKELSDKKQYPLSDYDYELVLDDKDPGEIMILKIFEDDYDLGREYVKHADIPERIKSCLDYSLLGGKLMDEEYAEYVELEDCRIIEKKSI